MGIDTVNIENFLNLPADMIVYSMLINFGWIPIAAVILWGAKEVWVEYIQEQWSAKFKKILLAIDVPRGNEQTIEAVENMMTYFAGAHGTFNLIDIYWEGKFIPSFSFEIVSIDGYTQFIIRTNEQFRNLVESAIYSQYPDAEITEVNDYTVDMPTIFPDDEWDMWGGEFVLVKHWAYPIKTYKDFQTVSGTPETQFKDPMASLMDLCSSLNPGEQLWYQLIVVPEGFDWPKESENQIKKILGESTDSKPKGFGFLGGVFGEVKSVFDEMTRQIMDMIFGMGSGSEEEKKDEPLFRMMNLKPSEKRQVEAITEKAAKLGFDCKQRFIYIAKKDVMNKPKVVNGFVGYMKQFMHLDLNNIKPDMEKTVTTSEYFFKKYQLNRKKRKLMQGYKDRDGTVGRSRYILTIDELATLWHFPLEAVVKAPLIQKAPGRKAKPPVTLPFGNEVVDESAVTFGLRDDRDDENIFTVEDKPEKQGEKRKETLVDLPEEEKSERSGVPPSNLPIG